MMAQPRKRLPDTSTKRRATYCSQALRSFTACRFHRHIRSEPLRRPTDSRPCQTQRIDENATE
ncbi:hypothetical protein BC834DRAFT_870424 [Gloeopeniophorella convolvens]|nr:hypothetical protein BC834DRAFT_870424 [Gloeopeniophorella convolvens]